MQQPCPLPPLLPLQAFELVAGMMSGEAGEAEECTCVHIYPSAAETGLRNRTTFD